MLNKCGTEGNAAKECCSRESKAEALTPHFYELRFASSLPRLGVELHGKPLELCPSEILITLSQDCVLAAAGQRRLYTRSIFYPELSVGDPWESFNRTLASMRRTLPSQWAKHWHLAPSPKARLVKRMERARPPSLLSRSEPSSEGLRLAYLGQRLRRCDRPNILTDRTVKPQSS